MKSSGERAGVPLNSGMCELYNIATLNVMGKIEISSGIRVLCTLLYDYFAFRILSQ
jgi:hypothetical protein